MSTVTGYSDTGIIRQAVTTHGIETTIRVIRDRDKNQDGSGLEPRWPKENNISPLATTEWLILDVHMKE